MANNLNTFTGVSGVINGVSFNTTNNFASTPTGSIAEISSTLVNTGSWQLVFTGSSGQPIGTIAFFSSNTTGTGSVSVSTSSLGSPVLFTVPAGGAAISTNYNSPLAALYAQATTTASYGVFYILSA